MKIQPLEQKAKTMGSGGGIVDPCDDLVSNGILVDPKTTDTRVAAIQPVMFGYPAVDEILSCHA